MASSGTFGPLKIWAAGSWTSQLLDVSLQSFQDSGENRWGILRWKESGTSDSTTARVRVDILNSNKTILQKDLSGNVVINNSRFNRSIDLSLYKNVFSKDIYIRFKLQKLSGSPTVENIELNSNKKW